ncbi:hypothetical protein TCAL_01477 [Tigriopus californicus]|uniref:C2H2-type domain-containing protein n=1 Tax=Tigriopus californicus TaxID=6832 RepID=A0A553N851_TIGCA|nr:hypothetical protein TCAL_01477 [Tigriopus californicus]
MDPGPPPSPPLIDLTQSDDLAQPVSGFLRVRDFAAIDSLNQPTVGSTPTTPTSTPSAAAKRQSVKAEAGPEPDLIQTSILEAADDRHLVLVLRNGPHARHKYVRRVECGNYPAQIFLPEEMFQSLERDQVSWNNVQYKVIHRVNGAPFTLKFTFPSPFLRSVMVRAPQNMADVLDLMTENRAFLLTIKMLWQIDQEYQRTTNHRFILYAEHTMFKVLYFVECLEKTLRMRKVFSYLKNPENDVTPEDRRKVREDLDAVLMFLRRESLVAIVHEEERMYKLSQGVVKNYRRLLLDYVRLVKIRMSKIIVDEARVLPKSMAVLASPQQPRGTEPRSSISISLTAQPRSDCPLQPVQTSSSTPHSDSSSAAPVPPVAAPPSAVTPLSDRSYSNPTTSACRVSTLSPPPALAPLSPIPPSPVTPSPAPPPYSTPTPSSSSPPPPSKTTNTTNQVLPVLRAIIPQAPRPSPMKSSCEVVCPFCPLTFHHATYFFFKHLGLYHLPPLKELQICDMKNCNYQILGRVEHVRHLQSHTKSSLFISSVKKLGQFLSEFERVEDDILESFKGLNINICPICRIAISNQSVLEEHIILTHLLSDILPHIPPKNSAESLHNCPRITCKRTFTNILQLVMHLASDHQLAYEFVRFWSLEGTKSASTTTIECPFEGCKSTFDSHPGRNLRLCKHLSDHVPYATKNSYKQLHRIQEKEQGVKKTSATEDMHANLCWVKSLTMSEMKSKSGHRVWDESLPSNCHMHLCLMCVNYKHQAKYFHSHHALLLHLIEEHFKVTLTKEVYGIHKDQIEQSQSSQMIRCSKCAKSIPASRFIYHLNLLHEEVLNLVPKHLSYNFKYLNQVHPPNQLSALSSSKPGVSLLRTDSGLKPSKTNQGQINSMSIALQKFCAQRQLALDSLELVQLKTFAQMHMKTEQVSKDDLEKFLATLSPGLCQKISSQEVCQLRALLLKEPEGPSQPTIDFHEEVHSGDNSPLVMVSQRLEDEIPLTEWTGESFPVVCKNCGIDFKTIQELFRHLQIHHTNPQLEHYLLCKSCRTRFRIAPSETKYFVLHVYSRAHLFHQWSHWHKGDFGKRICKNLDKDFLQVCTPTISKHCEPCNEIVTDLPTHLESRSHLASIQILNAFVKYCKGRAICPLTASVKDVKLFFELVHQGLTHIEVNLKRVLVTLSNVRYKDTKEELGTCQAIQDHIKNLTSTKLEDRKFIRLLCYACPHESYSIDNMLDHCRSVVHELNTRQRLQSDIPASIQCVSCDRNFKDELHLRLHVFSPHHLGLGQPGPKDHVATVKTTSSKETSLYCYLCQVDVNDKAHLDTPIHLVNEQHTLSYLEWCEVSQTNPVSSTHAEIMNYFDKVIRGNAKSLKCIKSLEVVDCIHEEIRNTRIINQPSLVQYAQAVDRFNGNKDVQVTPPSISQPEPSLQSEPSDPKPNDESTPKTLPERVMKNVKPLVVRLRALNTQTLKPPTLGRKSNPNPYSRVVKSVPEVTTCPKCEEKFEHATHLLLHVVSEHKWNVRDFLVDYFAKDVVTCLTCLRQCASHMIYALHQDRHHNYTSCSDCKNNFITPSQYYMEDQCRKHDITDEAKTKVKICLGKYLISENQEEAGASGSCVIGSKFYQKANEMGGTSKSSQKPTGPLAKTFHGAMKGCPDVVISEKLRRTADAAVNLRGTVKVLELGITSAPMSMGPRSGAKRKKSTDEVQLRSSKRFRMKTEAESESDTELPNDMSETFINPIQCPLNIQIKLQIDDCGTFICSECQPCDEKPFFHLNQSYNVISSMHDLATHATKTGHSRFQNVSSVFTKKPKWFLAGKKRCFMGLSP